MNGVPESQTAEQFGGDGYQVLIVAEKFQTGFDQPLLHTMYVDKVLTGLAAVQTLSRLNRIHPDKEETFVLDFRNDTEDITNAFEPYYGRTVAPPTDPNLLWDTRRVDQFDVLRIDEVEATVDLLADHLPEARTTGRCTPLLAPADDRFNAMSEQDQFGFKDALDKFVRTYSFFSQVVSLGTRSWSGTTLLPGAGIGDPPRSAEPGSTSGRRSTHDLRNEVTFEGSLALDSETGEVKSVFGEGRGKKNEPELEPLSEIIAELNDRFGLDLDDQDQLLFEQFYGDWVADDLKWPRPKRTPRELPTCLRPPVHGDDRGADG